MDFYDPKRMPCQRKSSIAFGMNDCREKVSIHANQRFSTTSGRSLSTPLAEIGIGADALFRPEIKESGRRTMARISIWTTQASSGRKRKVSVTGVTYEFAGAS
jgi:hypothetical protein